MNFAILLALAILLSGVIILWKFHSLRKEKKSTKSTTNQISSTKTNPIFFLYRVAPSQPEIWIAGIDPLFLNLEYCLKPKTGHGFLPLFPHILQSSLSASIILRRFPTSHPLHTDSKILQLIPLIIKGPWRDSCSTAQPYTPISGEQASNGRASIRSKRSAPSRRSQRRLGSSSVTNDVLARGY